MIRACPARSHGETIAPAPDQVVTTAVAAVDRFDDTVGHAAGDDDGDAVGDAILNCGKDGRVGVAGSHRVQDDPTRAGGHAGIDVRAVDARIQRDDVDADLRDFCDARQQGRARAFMAGR